LLLAGYAGGSWNGGGGIVSSWAAADPKQRMIGYVTTPSGTQVKPTVSGDVNLDFTVDNADFMKLYANFGRTNAVWGDGDINYDGAVNFVDYQILSLNIGKTATFPAPAPAPTPAPTPPRVPVKTPVKPAAKPTAAAKATAAPIKPAPVQRSVFSSVRLPARP
jgi:hypothetical protein